VPPRPALLECKAYINIAFFLGPENASLYAQLTSRTMASMAIAPSQKELDLDMRFVFENRTTTRVFVFNVAQALAAPDGEMQYAISDLRQC
jgi:hypothetical protein